MNEGRPANVLPVWLKPSSLLVSQFLDGTKNPISTLTEYCQKNKLTCIFEEVPDPRSWLYGSQCWIEQRWFQMGVGRSKKEAKTDAAKKAFTTIMGETYINPEPEETAIERLPKPPKKLNARLPTTLKFPDSGSVALPSEKIVDYWGQYSHSMLESAKHELIKLIDLREGYAFDKLKMKCGIYSDGRRDNNFKGWGEASEYFSFSGLPYDYLHEFTANLAPYSSMLKMQNCSVKKSFKVPKSNPEATATNDDSNISDSVEEPSNEVSDADTTELNVDLRSSELDNQNSTGGDKMKEICSAEEKSDKRITVIDEKTSTETNREDDPIIEDSFIVPGDTDDSKDESSISDPIVIDDISVLTFEEEKSISDVIVVERSLSVVEETVNDDDVSGKDSVKRKHEELEDDEVENGEIIDSDEDAVSLDKASSLHSVATNHEERKPKKQKVSNEKSAGLKDIDSNVSNSEIDIGSLFVIDRNPSIMDDHLSGKTHGKEDNPKLADTAEVSHKEPMRKNSLCDHETDIQRDKSESETAELASNNEKLETKFKCDICPTVSLSKEKMLDHLEQAVHYSASLILVNKSGKPKKTLSKTVLKFSKAVFKTLIPVCPDSTCSEVFKDIYLCASHFKTSHNVDESAYAIAEVVAEDIIKCDPLFHCEVCSQHFSSSNCLFKHIKEEKHVNLTTKIDTQTVFFCCDCARIYYSLGKVLRHRSRASVKNHKNDVRILHISLTRTKKKLLPFVDLSVCEMSPVESEINSLKALKGSADKNDRHKIDGRIRNLQKVQCVNKSF